MRRCKTTILLLGLGNPIMGDDGVGIQVLRMLKKKIPPRNDLEFKELGVGGLKLVEEILGYQKVFIIDSIDTEDRRVGRIREFSPEQFKSTEQSSPSPHVTNFATALELYRKLEPSEIPSIIRIFTVDIDPGFTFREGLSPPIQDAAENLVKILVEQIDEV
jgi:hydrogenase maturation protease